MLREPWALRNRQAALPGCGIAHDLDMALLDLTLTRAQGEARSLRVRLWRNRQVRGNRLAGEAITRLVWKDL